MGDWLHAGHQLNSKHRLPGGEISMDPALHRKCQHQMAWETQRSSDYKFSSEPVTLLTYVAVSASVII